MAQQEATGQKFDPLSQKVIGAAMAVHRELGNGFLEFTYQKALAVELAHIGLPFDREREIPIYYRGEMIDTRRADFVVGEIIVELKAVENLMPEHSSQLLMYLKAARHPLGLLLNFGTPRLQIKRLVYTPAALTKAT